MYKRDSRLSSLYRLALEQVDVTLRISLLLWTSEGVRMNDYNTGSASQPSRLCVPFREVDYMKL